MIAQIAAIFHWPLSELSALTIDELMDWRERAVETWNMLHGPKEDE